jgi:hypothetical protein
MTMATSSTIPMNDPDRPHCPTKYPELWNALSREFRPQDVKTLPKGKGLRYVTARTVMNRLDAVLGPENWWDDYPYISETSVICKLSVRLPDGEVITKTDAGGAAGMADAGDDDKSMLSDALKRAAAKFGVGRYLYGDGVPTHHAGDEAPMGTYEGDPPEKTYPRPQGGSPKVDQAYLAWSVGYVRRVNERWHALHMGKGLKDLLREPQLTGHLYLSCVEGAARGDGVTNNHRLRHVANAYAADPERVESEASEYVRALADEAEAAQETGGRQPGEEG